MRQRLNSLFILIVMSTFTPLRAADDENTPLVRLRNKGSDTAVGIPVEITDSEANQLHPIKSRRQRMTELIGQNKYPILLFSIVCAAGCVTGTYLLAHPAPYQREIFESEAFLNAFDSSKTNLTYHVSNLFQVLNCIPPSNLLIWTGNSTGSSCGDKNVPLYVYPGNYTAEPVVFCNETTMDAARFLYDKCGLNEEFWGRLLAPCADFMYKFSSRTFDYFCTPNAIRDALFCAQFDCQRKIAWILNTKFISVSLAEQVFKASQDQAERDYLQRADTGATVFGGVSGFVSLVSYVSYCVGSFFGGRMPFSRQFPT